MQKTKRSLMDTLRIMLRSNWLYIGILAFLIIFPHLVGWLTGDSPFGVRGRPVGLSIFWQGVLIETFILMILAMSYNLMFGFTGVISFGHALFFGLGGYTIGIILEKTAFGGALGLGGATAMAIILAGLVGFLTGLVSLRLKGVYFAIFTLAVSEMGFIYVGRWQFTSAEDGFPIRNVPDLFNPTRNRLFYYYFAMLAMVATFLFIRRLMNSPTGRVMLAIRENEDRAQTIGFNTLRYKLLSITAASMMAAGAGVLHVIFFKKVGPEIMSVTFTIDPLLMTIIGGIGTFSGPALGAAGLHLSERILDREFIFGDFVLNISEFWSLGLGIAFVIVVLIFPRGIIGTLQLWWQRIRQQTASPSITSESEATAATGD